MNQKQAANNMKKTKNTAADKNKSKDKGSDKKKITIRTIAEMCNVSVSTISLVINNKPGVRPEVRELVKRCVEDLGWRSNSIQNNFGSSGGPRSVAFIFNSWQPSCFGGDPLAGTLRESLNLFRSREIIPSVFYGKCRDVLCHLQKQHFDTAVFLSNDFCLEPELRNLQKLGTRVILAHCEWRDPIFPRIHSDHYAAGKMAADKLKEKGCSSPAFFGAFGGRFHIRQESEAGQPAEAYLSGIRAVFPNFDVRTDCVGDACGDMSEIEKMFRSGRYDSWILQGRAFFHRFSFMRDRIASPKSKNLPLAIFDTSPVPIYPVSYNDCYAENCTQIATLIFEQAMQEAEPEPMEFAIPYRWIPPEPQSDSR